MSALVTGHDTPGGSQGAASPGSGVWAAQPSRGRHQETRRRQPGLSLQAVGCTFMSIARYIQYILKHIELRIYGAHFSPVTSLFNCTNLIW